MTTTVECLFVSPTGEPMVDSIVEFQPVKSGFDEDLEGIVMPNLVSMVTDAEGKCAVELWPGPFTYVVSCFDRNSDAGLSYKILVPVVAEGTVVRLQDIVVQGSLPQAPYDQAALLSINNAKADALAAAQSAAQSAVSAQVSLSSAGLSAVTYDGNNRVTGFVLADVTYVVSGWGTSSVSIVGDNDTNRTMTLDGSGRISSVS
jgi:hypothetical protein